MSSLIYVEVYEQWIVRRNNIYYNYNNYIYSLNARKFELEGPGVTKFVVLLFLSLITKNYQILFFVQGELGVSRTSNALALDLTWFSALETASIAFQLRSLNSWTFRKLTKITLVVVKS